MERALNGAGGAADCHGWLDVEAVRSHFLFPGRGRVVTNNAASTQPPRELLELFQLLAADYENVHRGQSRASKATTAPFAESFATVTRALHTPRRLTT